MPSFDRLLHLSGCHRVLRHVGLTTLDAYRAATPEQRHQLHAYEATIRRLVADANHDVRRALWPPDPEVSWLVALMATQPTARLLSVTRGWVGGRHDDLLSCSYDAEDPSGERAAWRALCGVLGP